MKVVMEVGFFNLCTVAGLDFPFPPFSRIVKFNYRVNKTCEIDLGKIAEASEIDWIGGSIDFGENDRFLCVAHRGFTVTDITSKLFTCIILRPLSAWWFGRFPIHTRLYSPHRCEDCSHIPPKPTICVVLDSNGTFGPLPGTVCKQPKPSPCTQRYFTCVHNKNDIHQSCSLSLFNPRTETVREVTLS